MQPSYTPQGATSRPPTLGGLTMLVGFVLIGGVVSTLLLFRHYGRQQGDGPYRSAELPDQIGGQSIGIADSWYELMMLQAVNHLGTFFLPALAYWYLIERRTWTQFNVHRPVSVVRVRPGWH